ncbi:SDR family NAD(P)-dependent oxidoreductase [Chloroflexi bacterium TSY]|nr:SDR family NAD(P)-dependent oxidoreductase [Chloroflexi bacterium TSY]
MSANSFHQSNRFSSHYPRIILITGATDGIGHALARLYNERKVHVLMVGRKPLLELTDPFYHEDNYCQVDLAGSDCATILSNWLEEKEIRLLDLVIQNAGMGYVGGLAEQSIENIQQMVSVNLKAPISLTHKLYPRIRPQTGKIVFISSVASVLPSPEYAVYSATKAALNGFVRNLRIELAQSGVGLQLIYPGATRTGMHTKSGVSQERMDLETFPSAEEVAGQIVTAIERGNRDATIGWRNKPLYWSGSILGGALDATWRMKMRRQAVRASEKTPSGLTDTPRCLITGAAKGIGKAISQEFANAGYNIIGVDHDTEAAVYTQAELEMAGADAVFVTADLTNVADLERLPGQIAEGPSIKVLVHNAGINAVGRFVHSDIARQMKVIDVNFTGPLLMTAELLRSNLLAHSASFIFIASLSHFVSYPGASVYAATKDGLASYARSLSIALAPKLHNILTVFPGPTRTEHARLYSPNNEREHLRMPPEELARHILQAMKNQRRILVPGIGNKLFSVVGRIAPFVTERVMRKTLLEKFDEVQILDPAESEQS